MARCLDARDEHIQRTTTAAGQRVSEKPEVIFAHALGCSRWLILVCTLFLFNSPGATGGVVINEIMYHPVEEVAFNPDGTSALDLTEDVHEYVELHNSGSGAVSLSGWKLTGGISYRFPTNALILPGGFVVVAKDKVRLARVAAYQLDEASLFGPYDAVLSNKGETLKLRDGNDQVVDSVSYSSSFPWAISADALGADEEWTGLNPRNYQYRGRSLERVSAAAPGNDPANWLASPLPGEPSPGKPNGVVRGMPLPVVVSINLYQVSDEQTLIRNNQTVRIDATFSATNDLGKVQIDYFVDNVNVTNETVNVVPMTPAGAVENGKFTAVLPGWPDRSVVRYRITAERAGISQRVSPRPDDPFPWHAYFVTPARTSQYPIYDTFISTASLAKLNTNISQSPKRVIAPDPPGNPRPSWNATEPAIFVVDGVVRDIRIRHHGSRYNRRATRQSYKFQFPRHDKFNNQTGVFETDKVDDTIAGHGIFRAAGLPTSVTRWVDLYMNNNARLPRLEQEEYDENMLERYHREQQQLNPGGSLEAIGEIYKCVGTIDEGGEGPYGRGDGRTYGQKGIWTPLQQYEWTFSQQDHGWKGMTAFKKMIDGMWAARGDRLGQINPNIPALRQFFLENFDIDKTLTYLAVLNWMGPWDDTTQNHFLWQQANGKWTMLPWDFDAMFGGGSPSSASIYAGEVNDRSNNYRGPNYFKDSFIKAFRQELKERNFLLINTLLHPDNITALGYGRYRSFAVTRAASVNSQVGLGVFQRPNKPLAESPPKGSVVFPATELRTSAYGHSASPASPHASTVWEIRSAAGSYLAPIVKTTSSTNLTSFPIPFPDLAYGQQYFWRATHLDASGHPSLASDESSFSFGGTGATTTNVTALVSLDAATIWKYEQSGANPGASWTLGTFNDNAWPSGPALLALETSALPEPIRTTLSVGSARITYYFRKHFNFSGSPNGVALRLNYVIDDGAVIYLNGNEIHRTRLPAGTPSPSTLATQNVGDAVYEGPFAIPGTGLVAGDNLLAVEVHQSVATSGDIVFGLSLQAVTTSTSTPVRGQVWLSEVMADNRKTVPQEGRYPDWIELHNNSDEPASLDGCALTDDVLQPDRYRFSGGLIIPARGYQIVWCDTRTNEAGLHTGFELNDRGQTVLLLAPTASGWAIKDSLTFGLQVTDFSLSRDWADNSWKLSNPTPGATNRFAALGAVANLKINEWMASPESGEDWFEVYNPDAVPVALGGLYLSDTQTELTNTVISPLSFVGPRGFVRFWADGKPASGANHVNFKLGANGDAIFLSNPARTLINGVTFGPQITGVSQGRLPDGTESIQSFGISTPAESNYLPLTNVVINEVLSHTDLPFEDAIELFNPSEAAVNISGWYLSDSDSELKKYRIPDGILLPSHGFIAFYEYQFNADTNSPSSFALNSAEGDQIWLSATGPAGELNGLRTGVKFGAAERGISLGRFATSTGFDFPSLARPTFGVDNPGSVEQFRQGAGAPNATARIGPMVISEIMYHPPDLLLGTNLVDNSRDEYIEIYNRSSNTVPLYDPIRPGNTWRLSGGIDFSLPRDLRISPTSSLLLVNFDPGTNAPAVANFRARYNVPDETIIAGPLGGKLGNSGDTVELLRPDEPEPANPLDVPYITVDQVKYSDQFPWPGDADGSGLSLTRVNLDAYGNDAANWKSASPTPGWNVNPVLHLSVVQLAGGGLTLRFMALAGQAYILEFSDSLGATPWQKWRDIPAAERRLIEIADLVPLQGSQRFYRITTR